MFLLDWESFISSVKWIGPDWAMEAMPVVFLFGGVACGECRLAIWERQIWNGLCVVLGDKAVLVHAFVRTPNHRSKNTLISIFTLLSSSVYYTRLCCPLLAAPSRMQDELMILWNLSNRPSATAFLNVY